MGVEAVNAEKINELLEQTNNEAEAAYHAWGTSTLDDDLTASVRSILSAVNCLSRAVAELAAAPKPVGPFEAGKTYALILPESYSRYADATDLVKRELARLHEQTGATFVVFPPGTQLGIATQ